MGSAARSVRGPTPIAQSLFRHLAANRVRLKDGARVGQIGAAIYEQRTPLRRAAASVSRALTDEGLMSQEYFEEAEATLNHSSAACDTARA